MRTVMTNDFLVWFGEQTRYRYLNGPRGVELGKHSHPEDTHDTEVFIHRGYQCEACRGYWAGLEPFGNDQPEELPCLATEGCEGVVVALYPVEEPPPVWIPVLIRGGLNG